MKIYTLGTSNRSLEEFLEILKEYKITVIIDVRHWPTSRLFPHFKKENLQKFLQENGIEYYHLEKLGGYREGGYENYMKTGDFEEGLNELIRILQFHNCENLKNIAIICAEKFPWKCHRVFISQELEKRNFKVIHIIEKGQIWEPKKEPREIKPTCQKKIK